MNQPQMPKVISVLGLGLIGNAIARRLCAAGVRIEGYDPDQDAMTRLDEVGGHPTDAARVWDADCIISAVFDTDQLATLVAQAPVGSGKPLISVSTCDPSRMPTIANDAARKGYTLIEAPISGTSADLANGDAILLPAGDVQVSASLAPVYAALSRAHFHVGGIGNGNRAKLAINLVLGLSRAAVAEGLVFAEAVGLNPSDFLQLALESAAASKVMASKGPKMASRDFAPLGRIAQSAKDFELIREQARRAGQGLPMTERYLEVIAGNLAAGEGGLDNSAILLELARASAPETE